MKKDNTIISDFEEMHFHDSDFVKINGWSEEEKILELHIFYINHEVPVEKIVDGVKYSWTNLVGKNAILRFTGVEKVKTNINKNTKPGDYDISFIERKKINSLYRYRIVLAAASVDSVEREEFEKYFELIADKIELELYGDEHISDFTFHDANNIPETNEEGYMIAHTGEIIDPRWKG